LPDRCLRRPVLPLLPMHARCPGFQVRRGEVHRLKQATASEPSPSSSHAQTTSTQAQLVSVQVGRSVRKRGTWMRTVAMGALRVRLTAMRGAPDLNAHVTRTFSGSCCTPPLEDGNWTNCLEPAR